MGIPKFSEEELEIKGYSPPMFGEPVAIFNYPAAPREAVAGLYEKRPIWQPVGAEQAVFIPRINPDNIARSMVFEVNPIKPADGGGKDMFGIEWEYIPQARGSMVRPGRPFLQDANEWYDKLVWPDIDSWDWEEYGKANEAFFDTDTSYITMIFNGWYERLISFLDFEGAAVALIDDDQKQAVEELFDKLTDLYVKLLDKYITYFPRIDTYSVHDDWGGQKETFFSPQTAREMIVPYMQRVTDFLHSKGKFCDFHSCGSIEKQIPNIIAAGWDSWNPQTMNDTYRIYEMYGDKLLISVVPELPDPAESTEEKEREAARKFAEKFCNPEKPCSLNQYISHLLTPAFREELYKQSRVKFGG